MTEPDWDDPSDAGLAPLTPQQAESAKRQAASLGTELEALAAAYAQATSRIAVLEAENHDLRILLGLQDNERGMQTTAMADLREASRTITLAVAVLEGGYRNEGPDA